VLSTRYGGWTTQPRKKEKNPLTDKNNKEIKNKRVTKQNTKKKSKKIKPLNHELRKTLTTNKK
jgi:hypothetical protein